MYTITSESSTSILPDLSAWGETNTALPSGQASLPEEHSSSCCVSQGEGGPKVEEVKISAPDEEDVGMCTVPVQTCALTHSLTMTDTGFMDP